jgi:hypothetical protein
VSFRANARNLIPLIIFNVKISPYGRNDKKTITTQSLCRNDWKELPEAFYESIETNNG